jgi:hypothetical protein
MEEKIILRIEELSRTIGDLMEKRVQIINNLHQIDSEIDSLSLVMFELKSIMEDSPAT